MRALAAAILGLATPALADSTSGIDGALFRGSYDSNGVFAVEGARLLPRRDLSLKVLAGYGRSPVDVAVPGIGNTDPDRILDQLLVIDIAFALALSHRFELGFDLGAYRTSTGDGYGDRGRSIMGTGNLTPGTGLVALRRISNLDPSASPGDASSYLGDGRSGPLDARIGGKLALIKQPTFAVALVGSMFLPFGEDEMLLGDRSLVFEPKLAVEWKPSAFHSTRVVANAAARFRRRTVLESFDSATEMDTDAKVFLDVGSEAIAGLGTMIEVSPRFHAGAEAQLFIPLPASMSYGGCRSYLGTRCEKLAASDYFNDAKRGDLALLATAGAQLRISADVTLLATVGTAQLGARGDDVRITTGLVWAPQPAGSAVPGKYDRDGDGIPDSLDACPSEAEDKDGYQDEDGCPDGDNDRDGIYDGVDQCRDEAEDKDGFEDDDGCPERDNDGDGVLDAIDRCPDQKEDLDNFDDEDGCPDDDNDQDGIPDARDRCPLEAETKNGFEDDDGCPDNRNAAAPSIEERADRFAVVNGAIAFAGTAISPGSKPLLDQVAAVMKAKKLGIRVEVHVPRTSKPAADKLLSQQRAKAVADYLATQGVIAKQIQAVGMGSDKPVSTISVSDPAQARVDLVKRGAP